MTVRFHNGGTYTYHEVPGAVARQVIDAPSVGSALHKHLKNGSYRFTKH